MPERIAVVLSTLPVLIGYGRHLADTLQRRAAGRGFSTIAQFFGTARIQIILAHLPPGVMRGVALERLLVARANARDLIIRIPRDDTQTRNDRPRLRAPPSRRNRKTVPCGAPPASKKN